VRELLHDHVATYEQLEVLLLFGESAEERTAAGVAAAVGIAEPLAGDILEGFAQSGVLGGSGAGPAARYRAVDRDAIEALCDAHRRNRLTVMNLMSANALERLRTSALRAFASAFLLGKKDDR
jgi:hypothetical protein